jgi:hypothetical protein
MTPRDSESGDDGCVCICYAAPWSAPLRAAGEDEVDEG